MDLVYPNERKLLPVMMILSFLLWLLVIVGSVGIALVYMLFGFIVYLFVHSALISHIRGTGVKLSPAQLPELYKLYEDCCKKLGIQNMPEVYLLNGQGAFNAFATRFVGRSFVVLYSEMVDAMKERPEAISFYMGHELGHIHRHHLRRMTLFMPARVIPILGPAYHRACETTCDYYGLACCRNADEAVHAIMVLAAGADQWKNVSVDAYAAQSQETGRFWMSLHELVAPYPWLVKRVTRVKARGMGVPVNFPRRNPFAYLFALFCPGSDLGGGKGGSLLVSMAVIGMLAAIAIPNFEAYQKRAMMNAMEQGSEDYWEEEYAEEQIADYDPADKEACMAEAQALYEAQEAFFNTNQRYAASVEELGFTPSDQTAEIEMMPWEEGCYLADVVTEAFPAGIFVSCEGIAEE